VCWQYLLLLLLGRSYAKRIPSAQHGRLVVMAVAL
jgi:hypothetical protein